MMGYPDREWAMQAHAERIRPREGAMVRTPRLGLRYRMARFLVLTGARLIPDRPAVIGNSVIVFAPVENPARRDRKLKPAA